MKLNPDDTVEMEQRVVAAKVILREDGDATLRLTFDNGARMHFPLADAFVRERCAVRNNVLNIDTETSATYSM